ncbi:MAG: hypothetical protein PHR35_05020 [Kiritimatiellae bacterium]|nr:hypothetical protein [Kiritimatiellia bacterium]
MKTVAGTGLLGAVGGLILLLHVTADAKTLFLANYDGDTGTGGLEADFATGFCTHAPYYTNGVSLAPGRFGNGLHLPSNTTVNARLWHYSPSGEQRHNVHGDQGTLDFWWTPDRPSSEMVAFRTLCSIRNVAGNAFLTLSVRLGLNPPHDPYLFLSSDVINGGGTLYKPYKLSHFSAGENIHFAVTWNNVNGVQAFVNGAAQVLENVAWGSYTQDMIAVGCSHDKAAGNADGVVDAFRITDGVEYTGNFTPPQVAYATPAAPLSAHTLFLAHFDGDTTEDGLAADVARGGGLPLQTTGVMRASGRFGSGAHIPHGTSANASLRFNALRNIRNDRGTLDFWWIPDHAKADFSSGGRLVSIGNTSATAPKFIELWVSTLGGGLVMDGSTGARVQTGVDFPVWTSGQRIHIAVTWDHSSGVQLFVNGAAKGLVSRTWSATSHTQNVIAVGSDVSGGTAWTADGVIDELRITGDVEFAGNVNPPFKAYRSPSTGTLIRIL